MKEALASILWTVKSNPLAVMVAIFCLAILPGIVKLASMLPSAQ